MHYRDLAKTVDRPSYRVSREPFGNVYSFTWDGWVVSGLICRPLLLRTKEGGMAFHLQAIATVGDVDRNALARVFGSKIEAFLCARIFPVSCLVNLMNVGGVNFSRLRRFIDLVSLPPHAVEEFQRHGFGTAVALHDPEFVASFPVKPPAESFVYLLEDSPRRRFKIGVSTNVKRRLAGINSQMGLTARLVLQTAGTKKHEQALHQRFQHARTKGEWFRDCSEIREWISAGGPLPALPEPALRVRIYLPTKVDV